ncbi:MAG TPA: hypothetical protein DD490_18525 [Acidobacteria bacterium]|nr:hypothetical protein [Acidobacteriota bacterium]
MDPGRSAHFDRSGGGKQGRAALRLADFRRVLDRSGPDRVEQGDRAGGGPVSAEPVVRTALRAGSYHDSVVLMQLQRALAALPGVLAPGGTLAIYGPFNYDGQYTSASNASFDAWLRERAPHQGIRDFAAVAALATAAGLALLEDNAMPANNRLLVWRRH